MVKALRGAEIAGQKVVVIDHNLLEHDAWIDGPDLERGITGRGNRERNGEFADAVTYGGLPIALCTVFKRIDDRARAIVD